jgi:spore germination cell wall hydrolase CwlJ-like protein
MRHTASLSSSSLYSGLPHFALLWLLTAVALLLAAPGAVDALRDYAAHRPAAISQDAVQPAPPPAPPFVLPAESAAERGRAVHCLAEAVYYEAGFEPLDGQRAVAQVVLNRVRDRNFPSTVCGVVYQGVGRKTGCQFSFVCDGSLQRRPPERREWDRVRVVAEQALGGYVVAAVGTATHYHTDYVDPWWRPTLVEVGQIGAHIFYRWPGKAGLPSALVDRYSGGEVRFWQARLGKPKARKARRRNA